MVAATFRDVQVGGVFDGRDNGGADGGQVGRSAAGAAGRGIFAEGHVAGWLCASMDRCSRTCGVPKRGHMLCWGFSDPVGLENSGPYSELGFRWQCDEDPALILNTFKWLSRPP
jgi:hypothetical protein